MTQLKENNAAALILESQDLLQDSYEKLEVFSVCADFVVQFLESDGKDKRQHSQVLSVSRSMKTDFSILVDLLTEAYNYLASAYVDLDELDEAPNNVVPESSVPGLIPSVDSDCVFDCSFGGAIARLKSLGLNQDQIVFAVWGCKPSDGETYSKAIEQYKFFDPTPNARFVVSEGVDRTDSKSLDLVWQSLADSVGVSQEKISA